LRLTFSLENVLEIGDKAGGSYNKPSPVTRKPEQRRSVASGKCDTGQALAQRLPAGVQLLPQRPGAAAQAST
jgi:hypothetical protein